eukprot:6633705-Pyramimonas_sp.AAC.1
MPIHGIESGEKSMIRAALERPFRFHMFGATRGATRSGQGPIDGPTSLLDLVEICMPPPVFTFER